MEAASGKASDTERLWAPPSYRGLWQRGQEMFCSE